MKTPTTNEKLIVLQKDILAYKDARVICKQVGQDTPILDAVICHLEKTLNYLTADKESSEEVYYRYYDQRDV